MKDSDVRGVILRKPYDFRHANYGLVDVPDGLGIIDIPAKVLGNCAKQLDEQGLVRFQQFMGKPYRHGHGSINEFSFSGRNET